MFKGLFKLSPPSPILITARRNFKVCVVGAAGGIGQPLSLLLKRNKLVKKLSLYDIDKVMNGVAADVSHVDSSCEVTGFAGNDLAKALEKSDVVVVTAGMARKPGMTRDDLLQKNIDVVVKVTQGIAKACPCALIAIVTNPVNSTVPVAAEIMKQNDKYDPKRLFGVTTLDIVRARAFIAQQLKVNPKDVNIPVIGGHSGTTILPLLSQCKPKYNPKNKDDAEKLIKRIQNAGTEVLEKKGGKGTATLSMAHAAEKFTTSLLKGLKEDGGATEIAFVQSTATCVSFFATPVLLGRGGICQNLGLPKMDECEKEALQKMLPELEKNINKGIEFAKKAAKAGKDKGDCGDEGKGKGKGKGAKDKGKKKESKPKGDKESKK